MAFSTQEKEIINAGQAKGKSADEIRKAIANYRATQPVTQEVSAPQQTEQESDILGTASDILGSVFGGQKIGEAIGTQIAKARATEDEKQFIEGPTVGEVVGDVVRTGATFAPVGKIAGAVAKGARALGIGGKAAQTTGNIVAGGATGAGADIGVSMAEGEDVSLGLGTALGAGIPASSPIVSALSRASAKIAGRASSEITGALTGTSQETIEQAFNAAKAGGKELDAFTESLRGKTTPEALVGTLRNQIDTVASQRSQLFRSTLEELGDTVVPTAPAKQQFMDDLISTGIKITDDGMLDFSGSKLRTVPNAQSKLVQAWAEIQKMPETLSLAEIDTTRQAIKGIKSIAGDEPSANLANMLIDDAVRAVRKSGEQVEGYGTMLDNFSETSDFLDEIGKGLMSGDNATIDQAYRRMATSLKTNNEQRMALVQELDAMTDGAILSGIAGQQLSEVLPRGIFRQILAGSAGVSAITGAVTPAIIPTLVFASPRAVGEFVRALGIGSAKADMIIESVAQAKVLLIKAGAITGAELDATSRN